MAYPASGRLPGYQTASESDSGATSKIVALMLGIALPAVLGLALWAAVSAQKARDDARAAGAGTAQPTASMPGMATPAATSGAATAGAVASPSFAGLAPANADAVATAHRAYPAELPALTAGPVVNVHLGIQHRTIQIAPGIAYEAWTFGTGVPGPAIHVRQGQTVRVTLTNESPMPHSVDFHAARVAPNVAFADVAPGQSFTFSFKATDPGVYMYHCGTKPVLAHIANGMYGAIVVDPVDSSLMPPAHHAYVLVAGEWYLNSAGLGKPAQLDLVKAQQMTPDWVTWNGYAGQYVKHPLEAHPGHTVRFYVVDAGPSLNTTFHVVGTVFDRAWVNGDVVDPPEHGVQTVTVPAGGGGIFDVTIDKPGLYPFVSHSFASVQMGQVGLLNVGNVAGTMSH
ncbi:MAG TPA: multicopper oxidase domain-containing protein [Gaiellaceae bacterium]|nr:multicopper oxidase domain-containing protein [Gaiellaceae bacterium]